MDNVWIALIGALSLLCSTVIGPALAAMMVARAHRREKVEDYERQDLVADRLLAANERAAVEAKATNVKLDVIHTLVNSNMTAAMQAELDATKRELVALLEIVELKRASGNAPSVETLATIKATQDKITELSAALDDRMKAVTKNNNSTTTTTTTTVVGRK